MPLTWTIDHDARSSASAAAGLSATRNVVQLRHRPSACSRAAPGRRHSASPSSRAACSAPLGLPDDARPVVSAKLDTGQVEPGRVRGRRLPDKLPAEPTDIHRNQPWHAPGIILALFEVYAAPVLC